MITMTIIGFTGIDGSVFQRGENTVLNFSVAHNHTAGAEKYTTWVNCNWWNPPPEIADKIVKGSLVYVSGYPFIDKYKKHGKEVTVFKCKVDHVEILSTKQAGPDRFAALREQLNVPSVEVTEHENRDPDPHYMLPPADLPGKKKSRKSSKKQNDV